MIKKIIYISLLSLVTMVTMLSSSAIALDVTYTNSQIKATPNTTFQFGVFNVTGEDVKNNSLVVDDTTISQLDLTHMEHKVGNKSTIIFNAKIPKYTNPGIYTGIVKFNYGLTQIEQNYTIIVSEQKLWSINQQNITINTNSGITVPLKVNISNDGNIQTTITVNTTGDCVNYTYYRENMIIYPNANNHYIFTLDTPSDISSTIHNCVLSFTDGVIVEDINLTINVNDDIPPKLLNSSFPDGMALKPIKFEITASDNAKINNIYYVVLYENLTFWYVNETRFEQLNNITIGKYEFVEVSREHFISQYPDTELLGKYHIIYNISDMNGNMINGSESFNVIELDAIKYNNTQDISFIQTDYEIEIDLFELNFEIPVSISIEDIQILGQGNISTINASKSENYVIGIMDKNNNRKYFKDTNEIINITEIGKYKLLFTSNIPGRVIGKLNLNTVNQHVKIQPITFTLQGINYALPYEHFETLSQMGLKTTCDIEKTGRIETTTGKCVTILTPEYLISDANAILITTQKEQQKIQELNDEAKDKWIDENSSLKRTNVILTLMILIGIIGVYFERKIKDTIFLFD